MTAGTAVFSNSLPPPHLIDLVDQIAPRSMLLIYSPKDDPDEPRFNRAYYEAAGAPKEIWGVPQAGTSVPRRPVPVSTSSEDSLLRPRPRGHA